MTEINNYRELYEQSRQRKIALLAEAALAGDDMERYRLLMLEQENQQQVTDNQKTGEEQPLPAAS